MPNDTLPIGFEIDDNAGLPAGFEIDEPSKKKVSTIEPKEVSQPSITPSLPSEYVGQESISKSQNIVGDIISRVIPQRELSNVYDFDPKPINDYKSSKDDEYVRKVQDYVDKRYPIESPFQKVNSLKSWQNKLNDKYEPLIRSAKSKKEVEDIHKEYENELDDVATKVGLNKTNINGTIGYMVNENEQKRYEDILKDAYSFVPYEGDKKNNSYLKALYYKIGIGAKGVMRDLTNSLDFILPYKKIAGISDDQQYYEMVSEEMEKNTKIYDTDITNYIKQGKTSEAIGAAGLSIAQYVPMLVTMHQGAAAGLSRAVIGVQAFGEGVQKYKEIDNLKIPQAAKLYNALMTSLNFVALGEIGGNQTMQTAKNLIGKVGVEKARELLTRSYNTVLDNAASSIYSATSPALRGFAIGVSTQISNNLVDKSTIDPNRNVEEGVLDAGITWALMDKAMGIHKDITKAKEAIDIARGKVPKNIPFEDYAQSLDLILDKDHLTNQGKNVDESFNLINKDAIDNINSQLNVINQPRLVKEKINLLNRNIANELAKEYPDVNKVNEFDKQLSSIEDDIKIKTTFKTKDIDDKVNELIKQREELYKEELPGIELQKRANTENILNKRISLLLKHKYDIKKRFYDQPLKGINDNFDKDIHREEKTQAHDELKQVLPGIENVEQLKTEGYETTERSVGEERDIQPDEADITSGTTRKGTETGTEIGKESKREELSHAAKEGEVTEGGRQEHPGTSQGGKTRLDADEVREKEGRQAVDSNSPREKEGIGEVVPSFVPEGMAEPEPAGTETGKLEFGEKTETPKAMKKILYTGEKNVFSRDIIKNGKDFGEVHVEEKPEGWEIKYVLVNEKGKGYGKQIYRELNKQAQLEDKVVKSDRPDKISDSAKGLWNSLVKSGEAEKMPDNSYRMLSSKGEVIPKVEKPKVEPEKPIEVAGKKLTELKEPKIGQTVNFKDMVGNNRIGEVMAKEPDGRFTIKADDGIIHKVKPSKIGKDKVEKSVTRLPMMVNREPSKPLIKASSIVSKIAKDLNIPIRIGKIREKAVGIFKVDPEVIRTKEAYDLSTISHEVAHYLDKKLKITGNLPNDLKDELRPIDYDQAKQRVDEGFAEFMRYYMTVGNTKILAPKFHDYFENTILKDNPVEAKIIKEGTNLITQWREQGSLNRVLSQVDFDGMKSDLSLKDRLTTLDIKLKSKFSNRLYPLKYVVNKIVDKVVIRPSEDPYLIAMSVAKTAPSKARQFIMDGAYNFGLNKIGKSLKEVVAPVTKDIKNAIAYAYSKHAISLLDRDINPGITRLDAEYVLKNNAKPEYEQFAKDFTEWSSYVVDYLVDAGGLSKDAAQLMRDTNPFYIPLKRSIVDKGLTGGTGKGYVDLSNPIKRIKGSGREIISPLESMISQTEQIINMADKVRVARALVNLIDRFEGVGKWGEKIPPPLKKTTVELKDISNQIESLGVDMSTVDKDALINVFSQGDYYGKDNVVSIYREGKREFYELDKDLYEAMKGLDNVSLPWFIDMTFGSASRVVRLGATGIRAGFSLITNPIRDIQTFALQNEYTGISKIWKVGTAIGEELIGKSEYSKQFKRAGGEMAQPLGLDRKMVKNAVEEILADNVQIKALGIVKHPIEALRKILSFTEAGTRLAEFKSVMESYEPRFEKARIDGDLVELKKLQEDAAIEASNAANEVTVNFKRAGTYSAVINQIVPFFNPAIQGITRMGRTIYEHPTRSGFRALAMMTAPTLALWYLHKDEKWYQELPDWQKYGFWNFKMGDEIIRLPKPFEWGYLFAAIPEGVANSIYTKDPGYYKNAFKESAGAMIPPVMPALVKPAMEVYFNWDIFRDAPLVSKSQEGLLPPQQYTSHTSKLAIEAGNILNVAPINIDHLLSGYTGGLATDILNSFPKEYKEKADWPVIGRLFTRSSTVGFGGLSVQKFYDEFKRMNSLDKTLSFAEKKSIKPRNISNEDYKFYEHKYLVTGTAKQLTDLRNKLTEIDGLKIDRDIKKKMINEVNIAASKLARETINKIKGEAEPEFKFLNTVNKLKSIESEINDVVKEFGSNEALKYAKGKNMEKEYVFIKKNSSEISALKLVIDVFEKMSKSEQEIYKNQIESNINQVNSAFTNNSRVRLNSTVSKIYRQYILKLKNIKKEEKKVVRNLD